MGHLLIFFGNVWAFFKKTNNWILSIYWAFYFTNKLITNKLSTCIWGPTHDGLGAGALGEIADH